MARRRRGWAGGGAAMLALLLSACAPGAGPARTGPPEAIAITFEETEAPGVFTLEALGRRDRPKGAGGLWAAVPGLRRPERAEVINIETGARVTVSLFSGGAPAGEARLSNDAAEALAIGGVPRRVRITALRREPRLVAP